jgi:hypothetical protein
MEHNGDYRSCPVMELESIGGDMKINTDAAHMMFSGCLMTQTFSLPSFQLDLSP